MFYRIFKILVFIVLCFDFQDSNCMLRLFFSVKNDKEKAFELKAMLVKVKKEIESNPDILKTIEDDFAQYLKDKEEWTVAFPGLYEEELKDKEKLKNNFVKDRLRVIILEEYEKRVEEYKEAIKNKNLKETEKWKNSFSSRSSQEFSILYPETQVGLDVHDNSSSDNSDDNDVHAFLYERFKENVFLSGIVLAKLDDSINTCFELDDLKIGADLNKSVDGYLLKLSQDRVRGIVKQAKNNFMRAGSKLLQADNIVKQEKENFKKAEDNLRLADHTVIDDYVRLKNIVYQVEADFEIAKSNFEQAKNNSRFSLDAQQDYQQDYYVEDYRKKCKKVLEKKYDFTKYFSKKKSELDCMEQAARQLLGVSEFADKHEITRAYRSLALTQHPDKAFEESVNFIELRNAYEFLIFRKVKSRSANRSLEL